MRKRPTGGEIFTSSIVDDFTSKRSSDISIHWVAVALAHSFRTHRGPAQVERLREYTGWFKKLSAHFYISTHAYIYLLES